MSSLLRLTGELETMSMGDLAQIISNGKKSGTLELRSGDDCLRFVFRGGALVGAISGATGTPDEQLPHVLGRSGILSRVELEAVSAAAARRKTFFGQTLAALHLVDPERLEEALRTWVQNLFAEALEWRQGSLEFRESREDEVPSLPTLISVDRLLIKVFQ